MGSSIFFLLHAGYLNKSFALHLFFTLLLGKRPFKFACCRQRHAQTIRSKDPKSWVLWNCDSCQGNLNRYICFIEDTGHIASELRPFCELHAAVSKPQNWRDKIGTRQWNHQKDRKNRIWWNIFYSDVYMHRNAVDETLRPIDDFDSIGA